MKYLIYTFDKPQQQALLILLDNLYRHFLRNDLYGMEAVGFEATYERLLNLNQANAKMVDSLREGMDDFMDDRKFILTQHAVTWIEKSMEVFYSEQRLVSKAEAKIVQRSYESLCTIVFDTPKIFMTEEQVHAMI